MHRYTNRIIHKDVDRNTQIFSTFNDVNTFQLSFRTNLCRFGFVVCFVRSFDFDTWLYTHCLTHVGLTARTGGGAVNCREVRHKMAAQSFTFQCTQNVHSPHSLFIVGKNE